MAQLIKHAVHLRLLDSHGVLQGLDPIICSIQGNPVAIKPLLHLRKLPIDVLILHHQLSEGITERSPHLLQHLFLVIEELLVVLQGHLIETRLLLHPVQLKLS